MADKDSWYTPIGTGLSKVGSALKTGLTNLGDFFYGNGNTSFTTEPPKLTPSYDQLGEFAGYTGSDGRFYSIGTDGTLSASKTSSLTGGNNMSGLAAAGGIMGGLSAIGELAQGIGGILNYFNGRKQLKLARDQFNFQKNSFIQQYDQAVMDARRRQKNALGAVLGLTQNVVAPGQQSYSPWETTSSEISNNNTLAAQYSPKKFNESTPSVDYNNNKNIG